MICFGIQSDLLDQTVIQAIMFVQCYFACHPRADKTFLKEIAITAIEIAIKNNEDMVLKLDECLNVLDSFSTHLSSQQESLDGPIGSHVLRPH